MPAGGPAPQTPISSRAPASPASYRKPYNSLVKEAKGRLVKGGVGVAESPIVDTKFRLGSPQLAKNLRQGIFRWRYLPVLCLVCLFIQPALPAGDNSVYLG